MINMAQIDSELDDFRHELFLEFNKGNYRELLEKHCHPEVIATWQDGTSGQGYDAVLAEFDKLLKFIKKMQVQPETDMRLHLQDGNLVVASGTMHDTYAMSRGWFIELKSRWSATMIRTNGQFKLISFSAAADSFHNPVVKLFLRNTMLISASIAFAVGLALGILGTLALQ